MAWERVNCNQCGAEYKVQMYGPNKTRQWKIENWRGICDECKERLRKAELEAATAKTSEMDLPVLSGTEKQIAWAIKIRVALLEKIDFEKLSQPEIEAVEKLCAEKNSAGWWIDNRSDFDFSAAIKKTVKLETSPEAVAVNAEKDAAKAEATVYPENPVSSLVTEISIKEDTVEALYPEPNEAFRELVKFGLGYTWNGSAWYRRPSKLAGTLEDRAAELGHKLLAAGFSVRIYRDDVRGKAVSGDYAPEQTRWVCRNTKLGKFAISWGKKEDFFKEAKRLAGARYDRDLRAVVVPPESFEEVLDFAELNGFSLSDGASELAENAKAERDAALTVEIEKPLKRTSVSKPEDLEVPEKVDVPSDLMDEE